MKSRSILSFALMVLWMHIAYSQQSVVVDATVKWQNSGITVKPNYAVIFIAKGTWSYGGTDFLSFVGPDGTEWWHNNPSDFLVQNVNHMSLVGKIGENGIPFGIGTYNNVLSTDSGTIFLSMNDRPNSFSDNYGYLVVAVHKVPPPTEVQENPISQYPIESSLSQNFPNPFNPNTTINYSVSKASEVKIVIYDINGRTIRDLTNEFDSIGKYSAVWDGKNNGGMLVPSGTYFYQIQIGNYIQSKKMILLK